MPNIFCENINRKIPVPEQGANLRQILRDEGVRVYPWPLNYRPLNCGGHGKCTNCRIEVIEGAENLNPLTGKELKRLGPDLKNLRLSCQCQVSGDVTIRVRPSR